MQQRNELEWLSDEEALNKVIKNQKLRRKFAQESHLAFFAMYFPHYIKHETASFQKEIFRITEDESISTAVIVAFRNSGKSTIVSTSLPIWAITGKLKKKFILLISQTKNQSKLMLANVRREIETAELLRQDMGPFEESREWGLNSLVFTKYNARITSASIEQGIRGVRHGEHRPDLVIIDDLEDINSVKTREGRDKVYQWLKGDIMPVGDRNTKTIIIGNLLHKDSVMMRLKDEIRKGEFDGIYREYPLINDKGECLWPGKHPNKEAIEKERKKLGNELAWRREYLLQIIDDREPVVQEGWIKYYDEESELLTDQRYEILIGVDLAISEKEKANKTAMVSAKVIGYREELKIYILPNPINERLNAKEQSDYLKKLVKRNGCKSETLICIENVAYQGSLVQLLTNDEYRAEAVPIGRMDKRQRLAIAADYIISGKVRFPRHGAKELIKQIVGLGIEKDDDLADAFTILIIKIINDEHYHEKPIRIVRIDKAGFFERGNYNHNLTRNRINSMMRIVEQAHSTENRGRRF